MKKRDAERLAVQADSAKEKGLHPRIGEHYAIVTVSPIYHGRLIAFDEGHYHLEEAAWVVETGRLNEFVLDPSKATESEYIGDCVVERASVMALYATPAKKVGTR